MVKKKIIIVISGDGWGGAEKQAFLLKEHLGKNFMTEIIWLRDSCDKIIMPFDNNKTAIHYLQNPFYGKQLIFFFSKFNQIMVKTLFFKSICFDIIWERLKQSNFDDLEIHKSQTLLLESARCWANESNKS